VETITRGARYHYHRVTAKTAEEAKDEWKPPHGDYDLEWAIDVWDRSPAMAIDPTVPTEAETAPLEVSDEEVEAYRRAWAKRLGHDYAPVPYTWNPEMVEAERAGLAAAFRVREGRR